MTYLRVRWIHDFPTDPVLLYSELDDQRWEIRKVEVFQDGTYGYATEGRNSGSTNLGLSPIPPVEEIARDNQFEPEEITQDVFEDVWKKALKK